MRVLMNWRISRCADIGVVDTSIFLFRQQKVPETARILKNNFKLAKYFAR